MNPPATIDTLIVGAGPAGLAVGACLKRAGIPCAILEQKEQLGSSWRAHYDRLHLHTDKARSQLPYFPYPKDYPRYPSRLQVVEYLEAYAQHFGLAPLTGQTVKKISRTTGGWAVHTQDHSYRSTRVVLATGNTCEPFLPDWPGQDSFGGSILHSASYKSGQAFRGQKVLVVGIGNSGGEIAIDLCEHQVEVGLAVRGPVNVIPRQLFGLPLLAHADLLTKLPIGLADRLMAPILRLKYGNLNKLGLRKLPYGPMAQIAQSGQIPLIDIGTMHHIRQGHIRVHPGIERFEQGQVYFGDGTHSPYDALILATGYRPRLDRLLTDAADLLDDDGRPLCRDLEPTADLYLCGFYVPLTGMLRQIAKEAVSISASIQAKANKSG